MLFGIIWLKAKFGGGLLRIYSRGGESLVQLRDY
jgi:hypothetical protein